MIPHIEPLMIASPAFNKDRSLTLNYIFDYYKLPKTSRPFFPSEDSR